MNWQQRMKSILIESLNTSRSGSEQKASRDQETVEQNAIGSVLSPRNMYVKAGRTPAGRKFRDAIGSQGKGI